MALTTNQKSLLLEAYIADCQAKGLGWEATIKRLMFGLLDYGVDKVKTVLKDIALDYKAQKQSEYNEADADVVSKKADLTEEIADLDAVDTELTTP